MSLLIADIRDTNKGLDSKTEELELSDINAFSLGTIARMHCVILTNGKEFKLLKDRSGHSQVNNVYPIKDLIFFIYRYQSDMIETGSIDAKEWIRTLTKFLDSKQLNNLSMEFEKLAFEKS